MKYYIFLISLFIAGQLCFSGIQVLSIYKLKLQDKILDADLYRNNRFLVLNTENNIHVVSLADFNNIRQFRIKHGGYSCIRCIGDKCFIAGGEPMRSGYFLSLDLLNGSHEHLEKRKFVEIRAISYSKEKNIIATGHATGEIILWDPQTGKEKKSIGDFRSEINELKFSEDGNFLYSGDTEGRIKIWDVDLGKKINEVIMPRLQYIFVIEPKQSWEKLFIGGSGTSDGGVDILRIYDYSVYKSLILNEANIISSGLTANHIFLGLTDGTVIKLGKNGESKLSIKLHQDQVIFIHALGKSNEIISVSEDGTIKTWKYSMTDFHVP